jgi:hypothetical protein
LKSSVGRKVSAVVELQDWAEVLDSARAGPWPYLARNGRLTAGAGLSGRVSDRPLTLPILRSSGPLGLRSHSSHRT